MIGQDMAQDSENSKRTNETILGRHIGTATGWDQLDSFAIVLYDFEPASGVSLSAGDLGVNFETGKFEFWNEEGGITSEADIVTTLANVPIGEAA